MLVWAKARSEALWQEPNLVLDVERKMISVGVYLRVIRYPEHRLEPDTLLPNETRASGALGRRPHVAYCAHVRLQ